MQYASHHQLQIRVLRVDMATRRDDVEAIKMEHEPTEHPLPSKIGFKEYQQKRMTINARIKYREHALHGCKQHLRNGTFPKRMKSIKPYPTMDTPEAQAKVNEACQQVDKIILDHMIQEQERKLKEDQDSLQTIKKTCSQQRQQHKTRKLEPTVVQLQQELRDLQAKYTQLCQKLTPVKEEPQES